MLSSDSASATLFQGLSAGTLRTVGIRVKEPMVAKSWRVAPGVRPWRISHSTTVVVIEEPMECPGDVGAEATSRCLESPNSLVAQRVAKVDRWRTSDQKQQWLAADLLVTEPRLRRPKGFLALPLLRAALVRGLEQEGVVLAVQAA